MASGHDLEKQAAKSLEIAIQVLKDDPPRLATKLCMISRYMTMTGKEHTLPFRVISWALESVVNQNSLDMNALMEEARRCLVSLFREGANGSSASKENEMITNQLHARGGEASDKSAQPCAGHVTAGMKKPMPTRGLEENVQNAIVEKVTVKRKAGSSGSTTGEERKRKKQEELMPHLSKMEKVASPRRAWSQQHNPKEAHPPKQTLGNVSPQKQEGRTPTLPSVQVVSPPIPPTEKQCSSSPTAVSWVHPTRQRKRKKCVKPSSSPQGPPQRRQGKETVEDIVKLSNGAAATFPDLVEQLQAEKLVLEQDKEKLNKEKEEHQTAIANLQHKMVSVELEKSALTNQLQECEGELAAVKKDLNTIRANVKKATTTITKLNRNLLVSNVALDQEKEKVSKLEQKLEAAKKSLVDRNNEILLLKNEKATQEAQTIRDFLRSGAFQTSALVTCGPSLLNGVYTALLALSEHYPFSPEEVGVQGPVNAEAPDLSTYRWDRKSDKLVSEDGIVVEHPTILPNLTELRVRHPWIGPFPTLESEDEGSEEDEKEGKMGHVAGEEQTGGGIEDQQDKDEEHREKNG